MTIDVLMPVYKTQVEWVKEAIQSIRDQSFKDFTLVIVDDNNPPGELQDLLYEEGTCKCKTVVVRTKENKGISAALNAGLDACTSPLVVRMDGDDIARPDLLQRQHDFFTGYPQRHICGVQIQLFSPIRTWQSHHPSMITRRNALNDLGYWFLNHPGVCYRLETIRSLGGYGETPHHLAEDYALWIKFLKAGYNIYNINEILVDYRVHPGSSEFAPDRKAPEWHNFLKQQKESLRNE